MENKKQLSKEAIQFLIEEDLYHLIEAAIEEEYDMDRLDNLVYKEGGKKRATAKIKELLSEWEEEYNFSKGETINILINSFKNIGEACKDEGKEIIDILSEIGDGGKSKDVGDKEKEDIEKE